MDEPAPTSTPPSSAMPSGATNIRTHKFALLSVVVMALIYLNFSLGDVSTVSSTRRHLSRSDTGSSDDSAPPSPTASPVPRLPEAPGFNTTLQSYPWVVQEDNFFPADVVEEVKRMEFKGCNATQRLLFVGFFSTVQDTAMREVIRETNLQLVPPGVTTRFVICRPISSEADPTLWAEVHLHDDIYLVDCTENMNNGKTIDFYQHVRRDFPDHHYYFKTDMDSYVLFYNLAKVVDAAPRCLAYLGRSAWDEGMKHLGYPYMTGAIYGLSNDLVGMLESCGEACVDRQEIGEDVLMGKRVQELTNGRRHWVSFARTADYPYFHPDREPLVADPYAINTHMAKGPERWWTLHRQYTKTVTAEAIREERNFFGPNLQILEEIHCPDQAAAGAMPVLELAQEATTT